MKLTYSYTFADGSQFNANDIMNNYFSAQALINNNCNEDNFNASSNITKVSKFTLSDKITVKNIVGDSDINFILPSNQSLIMYAPGDTNILQINSTPSAVSTMSFKLLPIGTVVPFKGTFTNNVTMKGWYKCDGNNGTHNLCGKFIMGDSTSGSVGGSNNYKSIIHTHTAYSSTQSANHTHTASGDVDDNDFPHTHSWNVHGWSVWYFTPENTRGVNNGTAEDVESSAAVSNTDAHTHTFPVVTTANNSVTHTHTVTGDSVGSSYLGLNMPSYYSIFFIQRIA